MVGSTFLDDIDTGLDIGLATPPPEFLMTPNLAVIGVGGAGGNAVNNMIESGLSGTSFFVANTDAQALSKSLASDRIQLGVTITKGLGAGSRPEIGRDAAQESLEKIKEALKGLHLLFITAGMGGGTGTGAAPVIAKIARDMGILTVGVVSKPFHLEGMRRMKTAEAGVAELEKYVDTLIIIPNQNLFRIASENTTFNEAFKMVDDVLHKAIKSITDLVLIPGVINLDFADLKSVIADMGRAMMGTGEAFGDNRSVIAAEKAISNPLLDDTSMREARSILINISGGHDLTLMEVDAAVSRVREELPPDANIIFGTCLDDALHGKVRVSLIATGIGRGGEKTEIIAPVIQPKIVEETIVIPMPKFEPVPEPAEQFVQEELIKVSTIMSEAPVHVVGERSCIDVSIEVVEEHVMNEPKLIDEDVPFIPIATPVNMVPEVEEPLDLEGSKSTTNVRAPRKSIYDLAPSLLGKISKPSKVANEKKEIPTIMDDQIPTFFRLK